MRIIYFFKRKKEESEITSKSLAKG